MQIADQAAFLFTPDDELVITDDSWEKVRGVEKAAEILDAAIAHVESCEWTAEAIDLREAVKAIGVNPGKGLRVAYAAIEGQTAGLPLFDSMFLLGRVSSRHRLRAARERLAAG